MLVAAHCLGIEGVKAAVRTGCGTIEHAVCLDQELEVAKDMAERGIVLVATRGTMEFARAHLEAWSP